MSNSLKPNINADVKAELNLTNVLTKLWPVWIAQLLALIITSLLITYMTKDFSNEVHSIIGFYIWLLTALVLNFSFVKSSFAHLKKFNRSSKRKKALKF